MVEGRSRIRGRVQRVLALVALLVSFASTRASADTVVVDDAFEEMSLGKHLELAYDPGGELTIDDVLAGK
ncbi:MAG: hypothetical protein FJ095_21375, partial [Deltaproteobacteria bacterium]|nr:hypothetical protein [Deltaproteobacteria bacterium]